MQQNLEESKISRKQKENRAPKTPRSVTKRRKSYANGSKSPKSFNSKVRLEFVKKYNTRSRKRKSTEDVNDNESEEHDLFDDKDIIVSKKRSSIKVMFPWSRPMQRDIDLMNLNFSDEDKSKSDEESDEEVCDFVPKRKKVHHMSKSVYDPDNIPSPDEITQNMLNNVAKKASGKTYDAMNGTSCHQCRQKTKDTKTVCRSGECIGVRGQFCGPCLLGRYGESALEALKDPVSIDIDLALYYNYNYLVLHSLLHHCRIGLAHLVEVCATAVFAGQGMANDRLEYWHHTQKRKATILSKTTCKLLTMELRIKFNLL